MRPRFWLLSSALFVALSAGCSSNNNSPQKQPDPANSTDPVNVDVGPSLFKAAPEPPAPQSAVRYAHEPLIIPNCTVQYEDRQQVSAEVEAKIDLVAVKLKLLAKGTYIVSRTDKTVIAYDPTREYPGVTLVQNVPHRDGKPLEQWPQDSLIYDKQPDGTMIVLPNKVLRKGTYVVERRPDRSFVLYDPQKTYPVRKMEDGLEATIKADSQGVPYWEVRDTKKKDQEQKLVSRTRLDQWPDHSLIGEVRPDGSVVMADPRPFFTDLTVHPRDQGEKVPYRHLHDGEFVERGDEICFLDDQMVTARMRAALKTADAAREVLKSARRGMDLTEKKLEISRKLYKDMNLSYTEVLNDEVTLSRFEENYAQAIQTIAKAESEYEEAGVLMGKHRVTSSVNGIVRNIIKRRGEFVKSGEKIMDVQSTETVRLEGNLDVQYANQVTRGMTVVVEPALPSAPIKSHAWHRSEVTGIAVTPHTERPLIVSTSADGSALVWDPNLKEEKNRPLTAHILPHPVAVRSVACGPSTRSGVLVVTGADDGRIRVWDLTNPTKLPSAPKLTADEAHTSAVIGIAFSDDGQYFATAAGRDVFVWEAATAKKLYALPAEHRDTITCVQFTPQATLVTASKDRTIKVWKLGAERAGVAKTIDHRSAAVDVLGVSKDGGRVLFDQDKNRIDVISLTDKQTIGQIQNPSSTAAFATLALFSPISDLILTAGGEGELKGALQVWTAPAAGGRGAEAARLITPGRVGVTCAGFSPVKEAPFLVVGTEKGTIHVWTPPTTAMRKYEGKVMNVDPTDPRYVTVRVEMDNRELNLRDRGAATIIVPGK